MTSEINEIINKNNGRFGVLKNLGISLKLPQAGFPTRANKGSTGVSAYEISGDCRAYGIEVEHRKARALVESQRLQSNR
jgi:hypothetical protein